MGRYHDQGGHARPQNHGRFDHTAAQRNLQRQQARYDRRHMDVLMREHKRAMNAYEVLLAMARGPSATPQQSAAKQSFGAVPGLLDGSIDKGDAMNLVTLIALVISSLARLRLTEAEKAVRDLERKIGALPTRLRVRFGTKLREGRDSLGKLNRLKDRVDAELMAHGIRPDTVWPKG